MSRAEAALTHWKELLRFVTHNEHSDFYAKKFAEAAFDPKRDFNTLNDILRIPLLTRKELAAAGAEHLRFVPEEDVEGVSATSGTTSGTPFILYRKHNPSIPERAIIRGSHRVLVLLPPMRGGNILKNMARRGGYGILGDVHNIPASLEIAARLRVDTIQTTPTLAVLLKKYTDAYPAVLQTVRFLRIGGEQVTLQKKRLLHEMYPNLDIRASYGSAETGGGTGYQCARLARPDAERITYHPGYDKFFLEVLEPETRTLTPENQEGELVITSFENLGTPLIRYRTGDRVRSIHETCACGVEGPLLEILGRVGYDMVRAGGFELRRDMLEAPLMRLRGTVRPDFEVRIRERYLGNKPLLYIRILLSLDDNARDTPETKRHIAQQLTEHWHLSPSLTLGAAMRLGLCEPLDIQFVSFPATAKAHGRIVVE